jgi:hypothetical protein
VTPEAEIESLWINMEQVQARVRTMEKLLDVWDSPLWKLALFVIDGWPLRRVVVHPQWRPWRRWWTS